MKQQLTYPASKRSEIFEQLHESSNWYTIEQDGGIYLQQKKLMIGVVNGIQKVVLMLKLTRELNVKVRVMLKHFNALVIVLIVKFVNQNGELENQTRQQNELKRMKKNQTNMLNIS